MGRIREGQALMARISAVNPARPIILGVEGNGFKSPVFFSTVSKRTIFMDIDGTAFRRTLVLEALKRNPKLAMKILIKHPTFYIYGALYKIFGTDGLRRRFHEKMQHVPLEDFNVKDIDPEYLRILRLAEMKEHKVVFLTSNPENIAEKWEERIRNMFPRLEMEVRSVPTMEEKVRIVEEETERKGPDLVHFFDDSLPSTGGDYNLWRMEYDKAALLKEYELELRRRTQDGKLSVVRGRRGRQLEKK